MIFFALYGNFIAPYVLRYSLKSLGLKPKISGYFTVRCSSNAVIVGGFGGGNHDYSYTKSHLRFNVTEDERADDIVIGSSSWIGARAVILSAANVGEGEIIGVCSLVNKIVPPYAVGAGAPVRVFKPRFRLRQWEGRS